MSQSLVKRLHLADVLVFTVGVFSAGFGLKGFLLPNKFIDGGVTGISLILGELTGAPLSVLLVVVNLPFLLLGYSQFGRKFVIKSLLAVAGLAVVVQLVSFPVITSDKLLISVFGGFFLGLGIGLAVRGGAVLDGTEVLALYVSKSSGLTMGDVVLIFNILIFAVGAYCFSIETALYAILTYLAAARTVDFVIRGVEEYTGITIISKKSHQIREMITNELGRGATTYSGKGGYSEQGDKLIDYDIIFTVVTRLEVAKLQSEIATIDDEAFVVMNSIKDTRGGMIKRRELSH